MKMMILVISVYSPLHSPVIEGNNDYELPIISQVATQL